MSEQEYIESGILEAYVLGALSKEECAGVESRMTQNPGILKEVRALEETMYSYVSAFAVSPPVGLKNKIESALQLSGGNAGFESSSTSQPSRTIPFDPGHRKSTIAWRNAAAVALLIASVAVNAYFWNQTKQERSEKLAMKEQMDKIQTQQKQLADLVADYRSSKEMMADTGIQTVIMHTMVPGHPMAATLYWSKANGDTYVAMDALPKPPKGMQYQLWVIQKGKPVSMGVLPDNMVNTPLMQKISMNITSGDAFAISLEKQGGNPAPTAVYVLGKA